MLAGKTIVVGVTGGVAAHYLPELIGQLRFRHLGGVHVVMTPAAGHFVSPLTLATATGTPVITGIFEAEQRDPLAHIHLARLADDPVTLLLAATVAPVPLALAMHDTMWAKPVLQRNIEILKNAGYQIIPPEKGLQATGEVGEGRMAGIGKIISALSGLAQTISQDQEE